MKSNRPLSAYIHIPFCTLKCSYCDFNSYAGIEGLMEPFADALISEIGLWGEAIGRAAARRTSTSPRAEQSISSNRRVETVFFGGGTPSLMPVGDIERIMGAVHEAFDVVPEAEVSLEANPGTVDLEYLHGLVALGVNRLSFGVQSFHDDELKALDRIHSAEEAKQGYRWAREAGFERINLDLIYGLPDQAMERWQSTLDQAIELEPEHLSLYALTVEEGTKLAHDIAQGAAPEPDGDMQADMYEWSCERMEAVGYQQYEISNWCRPGEECRHNLVYWRNGEWLALGPGAHGQIRDDRCQLTDDRATAAPAAYRYADVYSPKQYIERVRETVGSVVDNQQSVIREGFWGGSDLNHLLKSMRQVAFVEDQRLETAMADTAILGLRLNDGLSVSGFSERFGKEPDEVFGPALSEASELGLLERENGRLRLTARGRLLANEVFVRLLP